MAEIEEFRAETRAWLQVNCPSGARGPGSIPTGSTKVEINDRDTRLWLDRMIERGWTEQILISHDIAQSFRLAKWGGHGYHYILAEVVPQMRMRGVSEEEIDRILVGNPRALLTMVARV